MNTIQLTTSNTLNALGHTCVLFQQENIFIFCHCYLNLRLASPNVNIFPRKVTTVLRNHSGSCERPPLKCMKRNGKDFTRLLSALSQQHFKYPTIRTMQKISSRVRRYFGRLIARHRDKRTLCTFHVRKIVCDVIFALSNSREQNHF